MTTFKRPSVDEILRDHYDVVREEDFDQRLVFQPLIGTIQQIATPTGRVYRILENDAVYPSMSRVCELLGAEAIENWKKRVGPDEANRISRAAAGRGTILHRLAETYLTRDVAGFAEAWKQAMPDARANWPGLRRCLDASVTRLFASEQPLYSHALRVAGTTDCIGEWNGVPSVIDFKTSKKLKKREWIDGYFIQTSGYAQMWEERTGMKIQQLVIVIAVDGENEPQVFIEPVEPNLKKLKQLRLEFYKQKGL